MTKQQTALIKEASRGPEDEGTEWRDRLTSWMTLNKPVSIGFEAITPNFGVLNCKMHPWIDSFEKWKE
jgi:hypothetical protein